MIIEGSKGIVLQRKGAGDRLESEVLYDDQLLRRSPVVVRDLNADGVEDWVFIGGDRVFGLWGVCRVGWGCQPDSRRGKASVWRVAGRHVLCWGYGWRRRSRLGGIRPDIGRGACAQEVRCLSR